jgi:hypothetical protein
MRNSPSKTKSDHRARLSATGKSNSAQRPRPGAIQAFALQISRIREAHSASRTYRSELTQTGDDTQGLSEFGHTFSEM